MDRPCADAQRRRVRERDPVAFSLGGFVMPNVSVSMLPATSSSAPPPPESIRPEGRMPGDNGDAGEGKAA